MAVKCPKCDSKNMDDGIYCVQCGTDLKVMRKDDPVVSSCSYCDADNTATATECRLCTKIVEVNRLNCDQISASSS